MNKHKWIIDMNEAIQMYLNIYLNIDCIDHPIRNAKKITALASTDTLR